MKSKFLIAVLGSVLAIPAVALAQSASESMHQAGEATENSAASAGHAIVDVYHGTKTAAIDTTITAKVKTASTRTPPPSMRTSTSRPWPAS